MSFPVTSRKAIALTPPELEYDKPTMLPMPPLQPPVHEIQQKSFLITLDTAAVFTVVISLVLLMHYFERYAAQAVVVLVPLALFIYHDYQNYLNLGPGGTPSTFRGYLRISWLSLWALRNPFKPPKTSPTTLNPSSGILSRQPLPYRAGPRPRVVGIAPQRQLDQHGSYQCYQEVRQAMEDLGRRVPSKFSTERSWIEKHGLALFARHPLQTRYQGEICHVHDVEYSMHMALHPDDIKEVLEKGWGQRHPLAWSWRSITMPVSPHFVLTYAPRDEQELQTICRIIEAAVWYTTAEEVTVGADFESCETVM